MRLAIADPPYLGRADRWYGDGRGSGRSRLTTTRGRSARKPDHHPDAARWDDPAEHVALVHRLAAEFDGWAVAGHASSTAVLLGAAPADARLAIWSKRTAMPSGARVMNMWEPVVVLIPKDRRNRTTGLTVRDVLDTPVLPQGFLGSKPPAWSRWVLDMLGYDETTDTVEDLFPGSGAVGRVVAQSTFDLSGSAA